MGHLSCSNVNGRLNLEGRAISASIFANWLVGSPGSNIYTPAPQWIYFYLWVGVRDPAVSGGWRWYRGNAARSRDGYSWQAFIGGRWIDWVSGTYGVLPYPVGTDVGNLSYVSLSRHGTYYVDYQWSWGLRDANGNPTGPWYTHWDEVGYRYC